MAISSTLYLCIQTSKTHEISLEIKYPHCHPLPYSFDSSYVQWSEVKMERFKKFKTDFTKSTKHLFTRKPLERKLPNYIVNLKSPKAVDNNPKAGASFQVPSQSNGYEASPRERLGHNKHRPEEMSFDKV